MNITDDIAQHLGKIEQAYLATNPSIQIYANSYTEKYQWRDSSLEETANQFENKSFDTKGEIIEFITEYINKQL